MDKSTYLQVKEKALPIIEACHDDLTRHDKKSIMENSRQETPSPFLHFTGKTGTALVFLPSSNAYPPAGKRVPYLFGTADRHQILEDHVSLVKSMPGNSRKELILYYGGTYTVKAITQARAEDIVSAYRYKILDAWTKQAWRNRT